MSKYTRHTSTPALVATALLLASTQSALAADPVTRSFCDPSKLTTSEIQYNGAAKFDATHGMWLTQAGDPFKAGTAFYKTALEFKAGNVNRSFWTYFRFRIASNPTGGNGLTFILQNSQSKEFALGSNGDGLGFGGITESIIFEFDTHADASGALSHISLLLDGDQNTHQADVISPPALISGGGMDAWLEYDHTVPTFKLYLTTASDPPQRPPTALTWKPGPGGIDPKFLDLGGIMLGGYPGFTSSTGDVDHTNDHEVRKWEFSTLGVPCDCVGTPAQSDTYCSTVVPGTPHCTTVSPSGTPSGKVCVECTQNPDCKDPTKPRCDTLDLSKNPQGFGTCEPCLVDNDCTHIPGLPRCDTTSGACTECLMDVDCMDPTKPVCDPANHKCIPGCVKDADCPTPDLPRCDTAVHECALCTSDDNCTRFTEIPLCGIDGTGHVGVCVECNANPDCASQPDTPVCNTTKNECVQCNTDDDCTDPKAPVCNTNTNTCECPAGQTCPPPPTGRFVAGGGCDCSMEGSDASNTLAALAAATALATAFARRRRRSSHKR